MHIFTHIKFCHLFHYLLMSLFYSMIFYYYDCLHIYKQLTILIMIIFIIYFFFCYKMEWKTTVRPLDLWHVPTWMTQNLFSSLMKIFLIETGLFRTRLGSNCTHFPTLFAHFYNTIQFFSPFKAHFFVLLFFFPFSSIRYEECAKSNMHYGFTEDVHYDYRHYF